MACSLQGLSSPVRDRTWAAAVKAQNPHHPHQPHLLLHSQQKTPSLPPDPNEDLSVWSGLPWPLSPHLPSGPSFLYPATGAHPTYGSEGPNPFPTSGPLHLLFPLTGLCKTRSFSVLGLGSSVLFSARTCIAGFLFFLELTSMKLPVCLWSSLPSRK